MLRISFGLGLGHYDVVTIPPNMREVEARAAAIVADRTILTTDERTAVDAMDGRRRRPNANQRRWNQHGGSLKRRRT